MEVNRRNYLAATGGALLAASAIVTAAGAEPNNNAEDTVYGHAMSWNSDLPGEAGKLRLIFDFWANVEENKGTGTAEDGVHPEWNVHFTVTSASVEKLPQGELRFNITAVVTEASDPAKLGMPVIFRAETSRTDRPSRIFLGDLVLGLAGVVNFRGTRLEIK